MTLNLTTFTLAVIDIVADRYSAEGLNYTITSYFEGHYVLLLGFVNDIIADLPTEDQFFVDLFRKVILRSVRQKVCYQRQQIRAGAITPEAARALIPRKDLKLATLKQKYRACANSNDSGDSDPEPPRMIGPSSIA